MKEMFFGSPKLKRVRGKAVLGAEDRQGRVPGFDQEALSSATILCIGAGGLISQVAPTLARKGFGKIILLDDDIVEASNLNRQRFYRRDLGKNKAVRLAANLQGECIANTEIIGYAVRFEEALEKNIDLSCDVAICGVDNNPARIAASRHFRSLSIPVIFSGVSLAADYGYVLVQEQRGTCFSCMFPDAASDDRYPCPGTPAVADILQLVGSFSVYAVDTLLMNRTRTWNYRRVHLADQSLDGASLILPRAGCHHEQLT